MRAIVLVHWDTPMSSGNRRKDPEWQRERWRIFLERTLPSVRRQTYPGVEGWLLAAPSNREIHESLPGSEDTSPFRWVYDLPKECSQIPERYFICRVDSDDMLAPEAVELMVEGALGAPEKDFVQLVTGIAQNTKGELFRWVAKSPPFFGGLMEAGESPEFGNHSAAWKRSKRLRTKLPMFCVTIHGLNTSTTDRCKALGARPLFSEQAEATARFGISIPMGRSKHTVTLEQGSILKTFTAPEACRRELEAYRLVPWAAPKLLSHEDMRIRLEPCGVRLKRRHEPELRNLLEKIHAAGINHRDAHVGNVVVHRERGPLLIDWEHSTTSIGAVSYDLHGPEVSGVPDSEWHIGPPMWWSAPHKRSFQRFFSKKQQETSKP